MRADARTTQAATDREAFGAALAVHIPYLRATAAAITLNDTESEDLVQTTLAIAIRRRDQVRDPSALRAWLVTVLTRETFRAVRRLRRLVQLDASVAEIADAGGDLAERAAIRQALRALPPRIRAVVVLHHMVGLSVAETAAAAGVSENTVKSQLKVGLARLREELRDA